jgi:hypothetical protein
MSAWLSGLTRILYCVLVVVAVIGVVSWIDGVSLNGFTDP